MTKKISFIGSAGVGKSTLAADIFVKLKKKGYNTELVSEFVRTDIHLNGPMKTIWEQYRTLAKQREIEDAVPKNVDWVIIDSGTLMPYFYSCLYTDKADERERLVLSDMYKYLIDDLYTKRYEHVFFLPGKYVYKKDNSIEDGVRFQTKQELDILDKHMNLVFTQLFKMDNIHYLNVPVNKRVKEVLKIILN